MLASATILSALLLSSPNLDAVSFDPDAFLHVAIGDPMPKEFMVLDTREMVLKTRFAHEGGLYYFFEDPSAPAFNASMFVRDGRVTGTLLSRDSRVVAIDGLEPGFSTVTVHGAGAGNWCACGSQHGLPTVDCQKHGAKSHGSDGGDGGVAGNCDEDSQVDLLLVYTDTAIAATPGGESVLLEKLALATADMNLAFANSEIGLQIRVVGTHRLVGYFPPAQLAEQLDDMGLNRVPGLAQLRNETHADLVAMISRTEGTTGGIAYFIPPWNTDAHRFGFSVSGADILSLRVLTHEVGHNFGGGHRPQDGGGAIVSYGYAHSFTDNNGTFQGTALAYVGLPYPIFSTPLVNIGGVPAGIADERDNSRFFRETKIYVANYRCDEDIVCGLGGNCFTTSTSFSEPGCANATCCSTVCAVDATCCTLQWDASCVQLAVDLCSACGEPTAGSCVEVHASPSCADGLCCSKVCAADPLCCEAAWDASCVQRAVALCAPQCGDPGAENCFEAHASHSCRDANCCLTVCTLDPACCETTWDSGCASAASTLCGPACGSPAAGACEQPHAAPFCSDFLCCERVCANDPFCCTQTWDQACADYHPFLCAEQYCGSPLAGSCYFPSLTAYCNDATCCEAVCAVEPTCCEVAWDQACANIADTACPRCGGSQTGACNEVHAAPFCNIESCCQTVCSIDPTCCTDTWDQACVDLSPACALGCGAPIAGPCDAAHPGRFCNDAECCSLVCLAYDPNCCLTAWDANCAAIAIAQCGPNCRADLSDNGVVDAQDIALLLNAWGEDFKAVADQDFDGFVDAIDLSIILNSWGGTCQ